MADFTTPFSTSVTVTGEPTIQVGKPGLFGLATAAPLKTDFTTPTIPGSTATDTLVENPVIQELKKRNVIADEGDDTGQFDQGFPEPTNTMTLLGDVKTDLSAFIDRQTEEVQKGVLGAVQTVDKFLDAPVSGLQGLATDILDSITPKDVGSLIGTGIAAAAGSMAPLGALGMLAGGAYQSYDFDARSDAYAAANNLERGTFGLSVLEDFFSFLGFDTFGEQIIGHPASPFVTVDFETGIPVSVSEAAARAQDADSLARDMGFSSMQEAQRAGFTYGTGLFGGTVLSGPASDPTQIDAARGDVFSNDPNVATRGGMTAAEHAAGYTETYSGGGYAGETGGGNEDDGSGVGTAGEAGAEAESGEADVGGGGGAGGGLE